MSIQQQQRVIIFNVNPLASLCRIALVFVLLLCSPRADAQSRVRYMHPPVTPALQVADTSGQIMIRYFLRKADSLLRRLSGGVTPSDFGNFLLRNFDPSFIALDERVDETSFVVVYDTTGDKQVLHLFRYEDLLNDVVGYELYSEEILNKRVARIRKANNSLLEDYIARRDTVVFDSIQKLRNRALSDYFYRSATKDSMRAADSAAGVKLLRASGRYKEIDVQRLRDSMIVTTAQQWIYSNKNAGLGKNRLMEFIGERVQAMGLRMAEKCSGENDPLCLGLLRNAPGGLPNSEANRKIINSPGDVFFFIRNYRRDILIRSNLRSALSDYGKKIPPFMQRYPVTYKLLHLLDDIFSVSTQVNPKSRPVDSLEKHAQELEYMLATLTPEQQETEDNLWRSNGFGKFARTFNFYRSRVNRYLKMNCPTLLKKAGEAEREEDYENAIAYYNTVINLCNSNEYRKRIDSLKNLVKLKPLKRDRLQRIEDTLAKASSGEERLQLVESKLKELLVYHLRKLYRENIFYMSSGLDSFSIKTRDGRVFVTLMKSTRHSTVDYLPGNIERDNVGNETSIVGNFIDDTRRILQPYLKNRPIEVLFSGYADAIRYGGTTIRNVAWISDSDTVRVCDANTTMPFGTLRNHPESDEKNLGLAYARAKRFFNYYLQQWGDTDELLFASKKPLADVRYKLCAMLNKLEGGIYRGVTVTITYDLR